MGSKWFALLGSSLLQRGMITYQVSGYQQRVFHGVLRKDVFNMFRRVTAQVPCILPGVVLFHCKVGKSTSYLYEQQSRCTLV
jgi:hypothetical protein